MVDLGLKGYRILVTASTEGIGRGIAEVLLEQGARIVINGRSEGKMKKTLSQLSSKGEVYGVQGDISKVDVAERIVDEAARILGGLDSVVYVTGSPKPARFTDLSWSDWEEGVNLLVKSAIAVARRSMGYLSESSNPSMVFSTSIAVKEPIPDIALSNVLRISVHGLVKTLARELAPLGIRVNAVLPGYIMTRRVLEIAEKRAAEDGITVDEAIERIGAGIPLGRIGEPREVGYLVAFLVSGLASYITGAYIPVDGGLLRSVF
jgi:3-oxoacyl-[acyl-carrier protein] reductase